MNKIFRYSNGVPIEKGDRVNLSGIGGVIQFIYQPFSEDASDYGCVETGGVLISSPEGLGLILIENPEKDEDLQKR